MGKKKIRLSVPAPSPKFLHVAAVEEIMKRLSNRDRNTASLVHREWFNVDCYSRDDVYISNASAILPERVMERFPCFRSLNLKGCSPAAGIDKSEEEWGITPWIRAMLSDLATPNLLEKLHLVRMDVSDWDLNFFSVNFPKIKSLTLKSCRDFTVDGLSSIASNCRKLEQLIVQHCRVEDNTGEWLTRFPEDSTSLVTLDVSCVLGKVELSNVERLLARSPNLMKLTVNESLAGGESIQRILTLSPKLRHLGIGYIVEHCKHLKKLTVSGPLTHHVFGLVAKHGKNLENLYVTFRGTDLENLPVAFRGTEDGIGRGINNLLVCCKELRKLKINNKCSLVQATEAFESSEQLRSLVMTNCDLSVEACNKIESSTLSTKVLKENNGKVKSLCIYRSVADKNI